MAPETGLSRAGEKRGSPTTVITPRLAADSSKRRRRGKQATAAAPAAAAPPPTALPEWRHGWWVLSLRHKGAGVVTNQARCSIHWDDKGKARAPLQPPDWCQPLRVANHFEKPCRSSCAHSPGPAREEVADNEYTQAALRVIAKRQRRRQRAPAAAAAAAASSGGDAPKERRLRVDTAALEGFSDAERRGLPHCMSKFREKSAGGAGLGGLVVWRAGRACTETRVAFAHAIPTHALPAHAMPVHVTAYPTSAHVMSCHAMP